MQLFNKLFLSVSMFIHLLTFLFQVGADYTIDEQLCFLLCVCDGYHFCSLVPLWDLSFLLSSVILNSGFEISPTISKIHNIEGWTVVCFSVPYGVYSSLFDVQYIVCATYASAIYKYCIMDRSNLI